MNCAEQLRANTQYLRSSDWIVQLPAPSCEFNAFFISTEYVPKSEDLKEKKGQVLTKRKIQRKNYKKQRGGDYRSIFIC